VSALRLAWAVARHRLRRRFRPRPPATAEEVLTSSARDGLQPLTEGERARMPAMSRCVNCGLCALVVHRAGRVRPPDFAGAYLRDLALLPAAAVDLSMEDAEVAAHALATAAAVCPVGVPLDEVAAAVRRLAGRGLD